MSEHKHDSKLLGNCPACVREGRRLEALEMAETFKAKADNAAEIFDATVAQDKGRDAETICLVTENAYKVAEQFCRARAKELSDEL